MLNLNSCQIALLNDGTSWHSLQQCPSVPSSTFSAAPLSPFWYWSFLGILRQKLRVDTIGHRELSKALHLWVPRERGCFRSIVQGWMIWLAKPKDATVFSGTFGRCLALQVQNVFYIYFFLFTNIPFGVCSHSHDWLVCADLAWNMIWLGYGHCSLWLVVEGREGRWGCKTRVSCWAEARPHLMSCASLPIFSCHPPCVRELDGILKWH